MKNTPFSGLHYLFQGFRLIQKPGLKRFIIIPFTINTVLFIGLFFLFRHFFGEFHHWIFTHLPSWLQWLSPVLWIVFIVGFFFFALYTFATLANLIAAPFNSLLSEKVETYLTHKNPDNQTFLQLIKDTPRMINRQLAIIGYFIPRAVLLLILFFIPIIQWIAALLWFFFNAWLMTLQYIDYPSDNHRIPFANVRQRLNQKRELSFSFGIGVLLLTMIPIVNCIVMPAAVAGATKMWIEEFAQN